MKSKLAVFAALLVSLFGWEVGRSRLNCSHHDIDINSGKIRHRQYSLGRCVNERIEDSPISRELRLADVTPDWRRAVTDSPGFGPSPHYVFHSAISQSRELDIIWELGAFTPSAKKRTAQEVLRLWQAGQCDDAADNYLEALSALSASPDKETGPTSIEDLPEP